jgi:hypothetical protein
MTTNHDERGTMTKIVATRYLMRNDVLADVYGDGSVQLVRGDDSEVYDADGDMRMDSSADDLWMLSGLPELPAGEAVSALVRACAVRPVTALLG